MRFQVPQFIEVEDKIFGPLTLKQFIYLAGGGGLCVVIYLFFPLLLAILFIIPVLCLSGALAFYKVNNKPFVFFLEAATSYILHPKLYIWLHEQKEVTPGKSDLKGTEAADSSLFVPKLSDSKLKELTLSLDTRSTANPAAESDDKE